MPSQVYTMKLVRAPLGGRQRGCAQLPPGEGHFCETLATGISSVDCSACACVLAGKEPGTRVAPSRAPHCLRRRLRIRGPVSDNSDSAAASATASLQSYALWCGNLAGTAATLGSAPLLDPQAHGCAKSQSHPAGTGTGKRRWFQVLAQIRPTPGHCNHPTFLVVPMIHSKRCVAASWCGSAQRVLALGMYNNCSARHNSVKFM